MGRIDCIPFVTRILVRQDKRRKWVAAVFACKNSNGGVYIVGSDVLYKYYIPYDGHEELLNSTTDPDNKPYTPATGTVVAVSTNGYKWYPGLFERAIEGQYGELVYLTQNDGGYSKWKFCDKFDKHFKMPVIDNIGDLL